ncbi:hypothetical protein CEUSTIGMA_g11217.t1 [Chlamydomonas eustigma]|uniref:Uncharacterized protein n=1 Tax=Chlamydomonas eustigma TaxID=1157962 RepID=A0A250XLM2_9CHLO|nr:hypothetical protein CEUSTIGMA_g11217.t1 [Chlamydomonas eustigma]|eukprot:GAX83792.1 hypothetical protein CEUSTIGMA_g11217.t1 [Chlamydomonas eustigma]
MKQEFVKSIRSGGWAAAIKLLDSEIQATDSTQHPQDVLAMLLNRGFCNQKLQLNRKALKDYELALALDSNNVEALFGKGQVLVSLNKPQEASELWRLALDQSGPLTNARLIIKIEDALKDPNKVHLEFPSHHDGSASSFLEHADGRVFWTVFTMVFLLAAFFLTDYSFKAATMMASSFTMPGRTSNGHHSSFHPAAATVPRSPMPSAKSSISPPITPSSTNPPSSSSSSATKSENSRAGNGAQRKASSSGPVKPADKPHEEDEEDIEVLECDAEQQRSGQRSGQCRTSPSFKSTGSRASSKTASSAGASPPTSLPPGINPALAVQLAVTNINSGKVEEAEVLLNQVLASTPRELGALIARGTARALKRDLTGAVNDFSIAIEVEPRYADTYKRRGQARSALGEQEGALQDLGKALELMPLMGQESNTSRADVLLERAMIFQRQRDYRRACKELHEAVKYDTNNHQIYNVLGLCSTCQGDIRDGVAAYERAVQLKPDLKEAWLNMGQALKEEGRIKEAEKVYAKVFEMDEPGKPSVSAMKVISQMRQQKGDHLGSIKIADKAIEAGNEDLMVELFYQRAICYHALGYIKEAVRDYEACMSWTKGLATEETRAFQYLSFYQKEMALYLYHNLDRGMKDMCLDAETQPLFKELWCKKGPPTAELIAQYTAQQPLPISPALPPLHPDPALLAPLTGHADRLGRLLQNNHQGFLPNLRQQRASGFAAIELAQAIRELLAARRSGNTVWVRSEGSSVQAGASGRHQFGWRDAMDIVVKWRQLSEPNDQVVWVDLLTRREFEQGFGSHTPMFTGQTKCVRYYMNFPKALSIQKQVLLTEGHAFDAQNRPIPCGSPEQVAGIKAASTAEDMYQVIRDDSWVVVPIHSIHRPGKTMEGTRLTLVKTRNQPDSYEFSIRTPVTPPRWKEFDAELEAAFETIVKAMLEGEHARIAPLILNFAYYWYNFMPLARGTAACGYTTILSLFWAAGMPVNASIPKQYQVDWEAILNQHPDQFVASVSSWMYPPPARGQGPASEETLKEFPDVESLPQVSEVLHSLRRRIEALNEDARRI